MNLSKLFEMQKALDNKIIKEKGLDGQELLPQKILALQVELGECANEWRGFKFWSERQSPKYGTAAEIDCPYCSGKGFYFRGERVLCSHCHQTGKVTSPLLEEYVDCLHFILSIGVDTQFAYQEMNWYVEIGGTEITKRFIYLNHIITNVYYDGDAFEYQDLMQSFLGLGHMLGFTWEQIEEAYLSKNQVNHERQVNGY